MKLAFPLQKPPVFSTWLSPDSHFLSLFHSTRSFSLSSLSPRNAVQAMSSRCKPASPTFKTVTVSFPELKNKDEDLSEKIKDGFGPHGLGILSISEVPGYTLLRQKLLQLAPELANLPEELKKELEDPDSRYNFGWSHGKEKLESGKLDVLKGSFYANPILDVPTTEDSLIQRYPSYCCPNIWPKNSLPELEEAFKALGKLMLEVGLMLAYHCDRYVKKETRVPNNKGLEQILQHSRCHKGRLLYYFPRIQSDLGEDSTALSSWCGWHTDHGSLTGLTCGIFTRGSEQIECPDNDAGLYIKTRSDEIVKVVFGEDEIAYQIGETTEILSGGRLCATPHCVKAPRGEKTLGVERSTFALFMQPDWDEKLTFPKDVKFHSEFIPPEGTVTFGEYSEMLINKYYG
ncbi:hypothetical protein H6P81_003834 [Aristolochia fimbriata]|uniref:Non-haem dioxygenase N-terminal domain-containing protein n=1 Tax=Aristolochia fimbriata TaxID=158543 RepID=A0AAV7FGQ6_ARIFI|nr:hypothetical protein H6P81_003834 [Aristolochia fimbriata]